MKKLSDIYTNTQKTFNKLQKTDEIFSNLKIFYKNLIKSLIITTKYAMFKITSL